MCSHAVDQPSAVPVGLDVVVLLDDHGRSIGTADRLTVHGARTPLHLGFSCYLFDGSSLLVTRRAPSKRTFAGVVTNSVCGHPRPGEDVRAAASRRALDELRVPPGRLSGLTLVLPAFRYRAGDGAVWENELCPVLVGQVDPVAVDPDRTEVGETWWLPWDRFAEDVLSSRLDVSPWCRLQVRELASLGPDPRRWPAGDPTRLPAAVTWRDGASATRPVTGAT